MTEAVPPSTACPRCGAARASRSGARFCEFCGSEFPAASAPTELDPRLEAPARRFAKLAAHPDYAALLAKRPSSAAPLAQGLVGLVAAVVVLVMGAVALNAFRTQSAWIGSSHAGWASFVPYVVIGVGVLLVARVLGRTTRFAASPLEARPALVVDERTQVRGGGDAPATTVYFVTLEDEGGRRRECAASGSVAGRVTRGDMGVAYVRADQLIDFERVAV